MNSSEKLAEKRNLKVPVIAVAVVLVVIVVAFFGYQMFSSPNSPCDSLFEQTTRSAHQKIESLKKAGSAMLDDPQIQKLSRQSQQTAFNLKTCCILFHDDKISFDEFLQCQDNFKNFEMAIDKVADLINETREAKEQGKADLADYKLKRINQTLVGLAKSATRIHGQVHVFSQRSLEMKQTQGSSAQASLITEAEPNDAYNQASPVSLGRISGKLSESDKADYFKFEVPSGKILKLGFTPDEAGDPMKISLHDVERHELWSLDAVPPGVTKSTQLVMNTTSGGPFYIVVSRGKGHYRVNIATRSQNDAGSGDDAADKIAKAMTIKADRTYLGELGGFDTEDWYQFEIPPRYILNLAFTPDPEAEAMNFSLRNFERSEIWYFDKVTPGVTKSKRIITNSLSGSRYYLVAYEGQGAYTFDISAVSQNDADSGADAGDRIAKADEIQTGRSYTGELGGLDEEDWYQLTISNGRILEFAFTPEAEGNPMMFSVFNHQRKEVWRTGEITPGVTKSGRLLMNSTSGGTYFIKASEGGGVYRIDLHTKNQNDAGSGSDAGDRIAMALEIKTGSSLFGELGGLDEEDWYTFESQNGEKLSFTCNKDSEPMKLALRTLEKQQIGYSAEFFPGMTKSFEIPAEAKPPYFIRIFDGEGRYSIQLQ
jgi:hypothetical protein